MRYRFKNKYLLIVACLGLGYFLYMQQEVQNTLRNQLQKYKDRDNQVSVRYTADKPLVNAILPTRLFVSDQIQVHSNDNNTIQSRLTEQQHIELRNALDKAATEKVVILLWKQTVDTWITDMTTTKDCGYCEFTNDRNRISDPETKSVVFHFNHAVNDMPLSSRRSDQYWVWRTGESTRALKVQRGMSLKQYDNLFNYTFSYRQDSDIYSPYGAEIRLPGRDTSKPMETINKELDDLIASKTRTALFMASNCGFTKGSKERIKLTEELIALGFDIDRRGGCFPASEKAPKGHDGELIPKYKFYLSFENDQFCRDYITEKFFNSGLLYGAVPIVWGAKKEDYLAVAPPNSFIYVHDYATTKDLADYLLYLDKNVTAYREYLKWRTLRVDELPNYGRSLSFCMLCRTLHGINIDQIFRPDYNESKSNVPLYGFPKEPRIISSLGDWFYGQENKECLP